MHSDLMPTKLPWNFIETVLLDMDGTLLDLHFDWHFWMTYIPEIYAKENNLTIDQANQIIHEKIHSQTGTLNWYCLDYWSKELNLPVAELKQDLKHMIKAHPEVITFLQRLKALSKTVIMVTNAHRDSLAIKLEMTEISDYFDAMISAHDYGIPKENPAIWGKIQHDFPFNPKTTLLIDDNTNALKTAHEFGIRYCIAATHVSPNMDKVDPRGFPSFENFNEIMP